jgi:alkylation response protein AidB-like acyl-CoA dehydrogenase
MEIVGPPSQLTARAVERLYRDAPLMIIGEGTNEIQRSIIARNLVDRYGERAGALTARDGEPDERRQIVLAVRQLVDKDVVLTVHDDEAAGRLPASLVERLADLGIFGALVPPDVGGLGLDLITHAMIIEEVARGWAAAAALASGQAVAAQIIARFGSPIQRERLVPAMTRGERLVALAIGSAADARGRGNGYVLSGSVPFVEGAGRADLFVVSGVVGATAAGGAGERPGVFLVKRDAAGLALSAPHDTVGGRGLESCDLVLDGVEIDGDARLADGAAEAAEASLRLGQAATAVGLAQAAFEAALRYSQQRSAFGQPICQHQAIQLKLADMATRITASRLLTERAATRLDADGRDGVGAFMARIDAVETAATVTLEAMRIHGGYGYSKEFVIERLFRDSPLMAIGEGTNEMQRIIIARQLIERNPI